MQSYCSFELYISRRAEADVMQWVTLVDKSLLNKSIWFVYLFLFLVDCLAGWLTANQTCSILLANLCKQFLIPALYLAVFVPSRFHLMRAIQSNSYFKATF